jgi:hypothetical protein
VLERSQNEEEREESTTTSFFFSKKKKEKKEKKSSSGCSRASFCKYTPRARAKRTNERERHGEELFPVSFEARARRD